MHQPTEVKKEISGLLSVSAEKSMMEDLTLARIYEQTNWDVYKG